MRRDEERIAMQPLGLGIAVLPAHDADDEEHRLIEEADREDPDDEHVELHDGRGSEKVRDDVGHGSAP